MSAAAYTAVSERHALPQRCAKAHRRLEPSRCSVFPGGLMTYRGYCFSVPGKHLMIESAKLTTKPTIKNRVL